MSKIDEKNPGICEICDTPVDERCWDGVCKSCHKSLDFEDCKSGTYSAAISSKLGYSKKDLKKMYPNANLSRIK